MALIFDGINDRLEHSNIFNPVGGGFTFAFRFKADAADYPDQGYVLNIQNSPGSVVGMLAQFSPTGATTAKLQFLCFGSVAAVNRRTVDLFSAGGMNLASNIWHNCVITWDGGQTGTNIHIYINDVEATYDVTENGSGTLNAQTDDWIIADNGLSNNRQWTGSLADLGFWNAILTAGERTNYHNGQTPSEVRATNLQSELLLIGGALTDGVTTDWTAFGSPANEPGPFDASETIVDVAEIAVDPQQFSVTQPSATIVDVAEVAVDPQDFSVAGPATLIVEGFEGNTVNPAASTVAGTDLAPIVTLVPYLNPSNTWRSCVGRINGVTGKSVTVRIDSATQEAPFDPDQPLFWRYVTETEDDWKLWSSFSVTGTVLTGAAQSGFTGDILVSNQPAMFPSEWEAFFADLIANNANVEASPGSNAVTGLYNTVPAATGYNGLAIPSLGQHAIKITSALGPVNPAQPRKIKVIHTFQTHSHEHLGQQNVKGLVLSLLDGSPTSIENLRDQEHHFVQVNPTGHYGGNQATGSFQTGRENDNTNRAWGLGTLVCVTNAENHIVNNIGVADADVYLDWHNLLSGNNTSTRTAIFGISARVGVDEFIAAFDAAYVGTTVDSLEGSTDATIAANRMHDAHGISPSVTIEMDQSTDPTPADYRRFGAAAPTAVRTMLLAGDFGTWTAVDVAEVAVDPQDFAVQVPTATVVEVAEIAVSPQPFSVVSGLVSEVAITKGGIGADKRTARKRAKQRDEQIAAEQAQRTQRRSDIEDARDPSRVAAREAEAALAEMEETPAAPIVVDELPIAAVPPVDPGIDLLAQAMMNRQQADIARMQREERDLEAVLMLM